MIKATLATLALMATLAGAAYLYLPSNSPTTPTTTASEHQPAPSPRPGNGRGGTRGGEPAAKMPMDIAIFGIAGTAFYGWVLLRNLGEMEED